MGSSHRLDAIPIAIRCNRRESIIWHRGSSRRSQRRRKNLQLLTDFIPDVGVVRMQLRQMASKTVSIGVGEFGWECADMSAHSQPNSPTPMLTVLLAICRNCIRTTPTSGIKSVSNCRFFRLRWLRRDEPRCQIIDSRRLQRMAIGIASSLWLEPIRPQAERYIGPVPPSFHFGAAVGAEYAAPPALWLRGSIAIPIRVIRLR